MRPFAPAPAALLAALALFAPAPAPAQDLPKEDVSFESADGVDLKGTFYAGKLPPGATGRQMPCVLMLHRWGNDRAKAGWEALAKQMQEKGYSVLAFDFRGHGQSKELKDKIKFWNLERFPHQRLAGGGVIRPQRPESLPARLDQKKFHKLYLPALLYDIAAARRYLDERNDAGEVNSGQLVVVAEKEAASLALAWIGSEYIRFGIAPSPANPMPQHKGGEDIAGAVFLSIDRAPLGVPMPYSRNNPVANAAWGVSSGSIGESVRVRTPMAFVYGESDTAATGAADFFYKTLFQADRVDKSEQVKYKIGVKKTNLAGSNLLGKSDLKADQLIFDYLDEMIKKRRAGKPTWISRNVSMSELQLIPFAELGFPAVPR